MTDAAPFDARCPSCGAYVVGTLATDSSTPYYRCGRVGRGRCPATPTRRVPLSIANVELPTAVELRAVGSLGDALWRCALVVTGASTAPIE